MLEVRTYGGDDRYTIKILMKLLEEEHEITCGFSPTREVRARLNWGVASEPGVPTLNVAAASCDKLTQTRRIDGAGVRVPPIWDADSRQLAGPRYPAPRFPLLARGRSHTGGKDIMPALQEEDMTWRAAAGAEFFSQYVPIAREIRVWSSGSRALGDWQLAADRVMRYPQKYRGLGRNFDDGFVFEIDGPVPAGAMRMARQAVEALGLDFGAVDMAHGKDGLWYVFEVNSAPGVSGCHSRFAQEFAARVAEWYRRVARA